MSKIAVFLDGHIRYDGRVRRIVESLSQFHSVDLFCLSTSFNDQSLFNDKVSVYHYDMDLSWINVNLRMDRKFQSLYEMVIGQNKQYDFVWVNDYPLLATGVKLKTKTGAKLIYDSHEIYIETMNQFFPKSGWKAIYGIPLIKVNQFLHSIFEKGLVKKADTLITVCNSFKMYFQDKFGIEKILVLKNCPKGVHPIANSELIRKDLQLDEKALILIYQGDVNIGRGIEKVAKSIPFIRPDVHFVVIGGGTKLEEFKNNYASDRIHFIGKVPFESLYEYSASAQAGIMLIESLNASKKLTLPNKVFEYMIAGIPIISNNLPEVYRVVQEENCGFIIDDQSVKSIAEGINRTFERNDLESYGMRGYKAVESKYNWEKEFEKVHAYIQGE